MKIPGMPVSLTEIGFVLSIMFLVTFLMALTHANDDLERNLPAIDLIESKISNDTGLTKKDLMYVTIKKGKEVGAQIFFDSKEVGLKGLTEVLRSEKPKEVSLRVDSKVAHGLVMKVMLICKKNKIRRVSFAYKETK
ncbi:MAG TPA: hypothetical protein ENI07_02175 [Desulfobacterales bacterium]|nr:hypothetical protein [Desulfobacterales bacterium]